MADCPKLVKCPFFTGQMSDMPSVAELLKQEYCLGDNTHCARFQVSSAGIAVPADLFPHETARARQILLKT